MYMTGRKSIILPTTVFSKDFTYVNYRLQWCVICGSLVVLAPQISHCDPLNNLTNNKLEISLLIFPNTQMFGTVNRKDNKYHVVCSY